MVKIFTDGACSIQHPQRPGGWGVYMEGECGNLESCGKELNTTNQRMEIKSCIEGLKIVSQIRFLKGEEITIFSDSAYVCNCFYNNWWVKWEKNNWVNSKKVKVANRDLWEELLSLYKAIPNITFSKVKGHNGVYGNEVANELAQSQSEELKREISI